MILLFYPGFYFIDLLLQVGYATAAILMKKRVTIAEYIFFVIALFFYFNQRNQTAGPRLYWSLYFRYPLQWPYRRRRQEQIQLSYRSHFALPGPGHRLCRLLRHPCYPVRPYRRRLPFPKTPYRQ